MRQQSRTSGPSLVGEESRHGFLMGHLARTPGGDPFLVLGYGGFGLSLVQLAGRCVIPQGLQHTVLMHRDHYSGFAAEADDVVTVVS